MLSSYLALQQSISLMNNVQMNMMANNQAMNNAVSFGDSQPLKPSFAQKCDTFELNNKSNETKISVLQRLRDYYEKLLANHIKKTTPKYAGLDKKA